MNCIVPAALSSIQPPQGWQFYPCEDCSWSSCGCDTCNNAIYSHFGELPTFSEGLWDHFQLNAKWMSLQDKSSLYLLQANHLIFYLVKQIQKIVCWSGLTMASESAFEMIKEKAS